MIALSEQNTSSSAKSQAEILSIIEKSNWYSIKFRDSLHGFNEMAKEFEGQLVLWLTEKSMPASVLIGETQAFFEPLLISDTRERRRAMMSGFELYVSKRCEFYDILNDYNHFMQNSGLSLDGHLKLWGELQQRFLLDFKSDSQYDYDRV